MELLKIRTLIALETDYDTYYFKRVHIGGDAEWIGKWEKNISFINYNVYNTNWQMALKCEIPDEISLLNLNYKISVYEIISLNEVEKIDVKVSRNITCNNCGTRFINNESNFCHSCGTKREYLKVM